MATTPSSDEKRFSISKCWARGWVGKFYPRSFLCLSPLLLCPFSMDTNKVPFDKRRLKPDKLHACLIQTRLHLSFLSPKQRRDKRRVRGRSRLEAGQFTGSFQLKRPSTMAFLSAEQRHDARHLTVESRANHVYVSVETFTCNMGIANNINVIFMVRSIGAGTWRGERNLDQMVHKLH